MNPLFRIGRIFFGVAMAATGFLQFFFKEFFQILFPPFSFKIPGIMYLAYLTGAFLLVAGTAVAFNKRTRFFSFALGVVFLFFFLFCQIPYELIFSPYKAYHLGLWINPLKEMAYAGGAFFIAGQSKDASGISILRKEKYDSILSYGRILFSFTMISFGISHFYYTDTVQNMVPAWIPAHLFWTYAAAIFLIASGIAIILMVKINLAGNLLGLMIFIWFIILHSPDAINNPVVNNGNEVFSAFSALAFSGIALVIGNSTSKPVHDK